MAKERSVCSCRCHVGLRRGPQAFEFASGFLLGLSKKTDFSTSVDELGYLLNVCTGLVGNIHESWVLP